ncbi:LytR/AlgR family response regulator transcription factor [Spirosoma linguale]|uniref:Two component transcriptional regulator, LytTR family n=1 Tax=Spirosoma linguale (strain ATCC 33905 / DSM 74 / LMG 10896 / Claus 1) TaxID=504472 RepID=D2QJ93_SPILD|nr:two component transcriptional regulator, LytTR family [Spirosoma linguale DSM 74]
MMNCLVVEDEPLARQVVETYIHQSADLRLVKSCTHAFEAFEVLTAYPVDLMFLDIELPSLTGIDFIRRLKQPPALIFTTAYSDYAVESYELEAVDYLLKPITYERFKQSVDKFFKRTAPPPTAATYSYFKVDGQLVKLEHGDIVYAQSIKDYILLKTAERSFIVHLTMKGLSELLPEGQFRRIHRSYLVNLAHVTKVSRQDIQLGAITLPIGESYRGLLNDFLN